MNKKNLLMLTMAMFLLTTFVPISAQQTSSAATTKEVSKDRTPISIASLGNKWNILKKSGYMGMTEETLEIITYEFKAEKKIVIDGLEYTSIVAETAANNAPSLPTIYLREDMETGIVYKRNSLNEEDLFMFDYNLKVGDEFEQFCGLRDETNEPFFKVVDIKEYTIAGEMRRVYTIYSYISGLYTVMGKYTWIEGIGCSEGFDLAPIAPGTIPDELICFEDAGGNKYVKYPEQGCYIYQSSTQDITDSSSIHVYIQSGMIHIICPDSSKENIVKLYAIDGKLLSSVMSSSSEIIIPIKDNIRTQNMLIVNVNDKYNQKVSLEGKDS